MKRVPETPKAAAALVRETAEQLRRPDLSATRRWRVEKRLDGAVARLGSLGVAS